MFPKPSRVLAAAWALLAALALVGAPALHAQAVSIASITGRVIDAQDAVVPNAQVKITSVDTGAIRTVTTNNDGIYTLPGLPVGPYKLEVSAQSFQTYVQSGIVLRVNDNVQINVSMSVGQMTETIQVESNASMVQTQTNTISQVIDQKRIVELPLNGRDPTQLILVSGASVNHVDGSNTGSKSFFSSQSISIAGGLGNATNYLLDGGDNNDSFTNVNMPFPFPDALQEFSVETSALPARNGLHPGGLVNAITKSGSNQWHGSAFEFIRNGAVNAINYFAPRQDSLKRNQFGGTFGGHIVRDKLFFFGGFQGSRIRQDPSSLTAFVPTPAALAGDFSVLESAGCQSSGQARTIHDPTNPATVLSNNKINPSVFDAAAVKLTTFLPKTNDPCGRVSYGIPVQSNEQQYVTRMDWNINAKHTFYGRYFYDDYQLPAFFSPTNILLTTVPGNSERAQSVVFGDTYSVSPTIVNSFHFTFSRRRDNRGPNATGVNAAQLGVQNIYQGTENFLELTMSNGGFNVGSGTGALGSFNINSYQEADDVDVSRGKHQMAFGVDIIRTHDNQNNHYEDNGYFQFNGNYSGDPLLDFLAGRMNKFEQSLPQQNAIRQTVVGLYAQDTWHATPKLVVNAGLRWEPTLFPQDYFGRGSTFSRANFDAGVKSQVFPGAPAGQLFFGDPGVPKAFTGDTLTNFSPRLGLVYNPDGEGKTTFRVGGAILYDSVGTFTTYRVIANNLPYGATIAQTGPIQFNNPYAPRDTYTGGNPFPLPFTPAKNSVFPLSASQVVLPPRIKPTYLSTWNASVQHQFSKDWVFSLSYLGNKASHLWIGNEINPAVYIPGIWTGPGSCGALVASPGVGKPCSAITNTASRRLLTLANPAVGAYYNTQVIAADGGNSNYHGMLTSLEHRFANNYTILANYTWSKCSAAQPVQSLGTEGVVANPYNLNSDYGPCSYDSTNIVNITGVFTSNVHGKGLLGHIMNNWQIAPLVRYQTGLPVNPLSGVDNSLTGIGLDRPDVTGLSRYKTGVKRTSSLYQYFDAGGFKPNAIGSFGTATHFSLRAPSYFDVDTSVSRRFGIFERLQLETRVEAFNVLNHPNFNAPAASLSSSTFGRITTAMDPRILQAAVKLTF